jgi:hypothetical protein
MLFEIGLATWAECCRTEPAPTAFTHRFLARAVADHCAEVRCGEIDIQADILEQGLGHGCDGADGRIVGGAELSSPGECSPELGVENSALR